jgi:hypothetical protein
MEDMDNKRKDKRRRGYYFFEDEVSAKAYPEKHTARLKSFGFSNINAKLFDVNEELTGITKGPIR